MLKQEEALAELDASISDWVHKLEMAENRRTRVRQKLLEHVAAAVILKKPDAATSPVACECSHQPAMRCTPIVHDIATPPRSPTKPFANSRTANSSPSPQRFVAQVPSTIIENPVVEEAEKLQDLRDQRDQTAEDERKSRADVESIRIYAGDDIATLFADVQNEISRISMADPSAGAPELPEADKDKEREEREVHRKLSHELLSGIAEHPADPRPPPAPPPPAKDFPVEPPALLTNAVFKP